jgi:hypothetical protein
MTMNPRVTAGGRSINCRKAKGIVRHHSDNLERRPECGRRLPASQPVQLQWKTCAGFSKIIAIPS